MDKVIDIRSFPNSDISIRDGTETGMRIQGYALSFNQPSKPMPFIEYIDSHAFDDTDLSNVLLVYGHEFNNILSRVDSGTLKITIDDKGLFFEAQLPPTQLGKDTYENINFGNIKGCSFGFLIGDDSWDVKGGQTIHYIKSIERLDELTLTPLPAYSQTSVNIKRSLDNFMKGRDTVADNQPQAPQHHGLSDLLDEFKEFVLEKQQEHVDSSVDGNGEGSTASSANPDSDEETRASNAASSAAQAQANSNAASAEPGSANEPSSQSNVPTGTPKPASSSAVPQNRATEPASSAEPASSSAEPTNQNPPANNNGQAQPADKGVKPDMSKVLNGKDNKNVIIKRSFEEFLKTGEVTREDPAVAGTAVTGGITLKDGSVIIPETILPVEHEEYQFPRLAALVRTVSVKSTTGKLPIFMNSTDKLEKHTEFGKTDPSKMPEVKPINWDLGTYTGNYIYSRDLIQDSEYNWQADLAGRLQELRDNTDDSLIMLALTTGIAPTTSKDLLASIKTALNKTLKPIDAQKAQIIVSQSAYDYLDQLKDGFGRPLIQPDLTKSSGYTLLGKTLVVIEDTLYPNAKAGDINVTVAPLQKAVIRFKQSEITGQFQDTYDIWYQILGMYLREDVVQARQDLIVNISATPKA